MTNVSIDAADETVSNRAAAGRVPAEPRLLPPEAPLEMPIQDLWRPRPEGHRARAGESDVWQACVLLGAGAVTVFAVRTAHEVMQVDGLTAMEGLNLGLFAILFGWIAYALANALVGFGVSMARRQGEMATSLAPRGRTALLMPIYNEDPTAVFARLGAMDASLRDVGVEARFDIFVLSDTRDPDIFGEERAAFAVFRAQRRLEERLFYRRRAENKGRKAGNVADWVRRFGGAYDYMVVLDADSVMSGETLASLAVMMDGQPRTGLIQTTPRLVNRTSALGRLQQFAARLYGPMLSEGLAHTSGAASNYWGHNAIIRTAAFAACAGLPVLAGPRPFGGAIMSHDFVEAALLRRGGWDIKLAPHLAGSYEECPPTLPDMIVRERRWCQGNLQHAPIIAARGLHWMSRIHLLQGVMTYLMPPVWLAFLLAGAVISAETRVFGRGWDDYGLDTLNWIVAISVLSLLAPRGLALIRALSRQDERAAWGDPVRLVVSVLCETLLSALIAPIMMIAQTRSLVEILMGRDSGWGAQRRRDGRVAWTDAKRRYRPHTAIGLGLAAAAWLVSPAAALWLSPVIAGLVLAIPLAVWTSDVRLGVWLKRHGLFVTPEERDPPAVLQGLAPAAPWLFAETPREGRVREALIRMLTVEAEA
jgi:membrane glycosyltransferase